VDEGSQGTLPRLPTEPSFPRVSRVAAPQRVCLAHEADQITDLCFDPGSSRTEPALVGALWARDLDRRGQEAPASQRAGDHAREQARQASGFAPLPVCRIL